MNKPSEHERERKARDRYQAAMHAVQSGVALEMTKDNKPTEPKHLRVGVNSALVSNAALVKLLVAKGVITHLEYAEALADEAQAEQVRYEERNGVKFG